MYKLCIQYYIVYMYTIQYCIYHKYMFNSIYTTTEFDIYIYTCSYNVHTCISCGWFFE